MKPGENSRDGKSVRTNGQVALSATGPADLRAVDETQVGHRQDATTPNPRLTAAEAEELDQIASGELDEAWSALTDLLRQADGDFDVAAARSRLARALPADLVAIPLIERSAANVAGGTRGELRNLVFGLVATGIVCAGLAALAFFGSDLDSFRRRPAANSNDVSVESSATKPEDSKTFPAPQASGSTTSEFSWSEDEAELDAAIESLTGEFDAERRRLSGPLEERPAATERAFERFQRETEGLAQELETETTD